MSRKGGKNKVYSVELKTDVRMGMREHQLGFRSASRKYELTVTSETLSEN